MSGYIKYFENGGKNMSFLIKDDKVWDKYDQILEVFKDILGINFHSEPVYQLKKDYNTGVKKFFNKNLIKNF